tara:strand:- start:2437 stop:2661 length:225 start_codon:yes stop_codon:yes gene_type:complete
VSTLLKYLGQLLGNILLPLFVAAMEKYRKPRGTKAVGNDPDVQKDVDSHIRDAIGRGMRDNQSSSSSGRSDADR